jgi:hypothetical protein
MIYIATIIFGTIVLLGVEWIFRLGSLGRKVLTVIWLAWAVVDAVLSAKDSPGFMVGAFFFSFFDSLVPLVLWQLASSAIRNSRERRKAGNIEALVGTQPADISSHKEGSMGEKVKTGFGCLLYGVFVALVTGGWLQHLYTCFNEGYWGFLIAGAIFFPIGIIHGWGIWLGFWH